MCRRGLFPIFPPVPFLFRVTLILFLIFVIFDDEYPELTQGRRSPVLPGGHN